MARRPAASSGFIVVGKRIVLQQWLAKQLFVFTDTLELVEIIPLPPAVGAPLPMLDLWSVADELIGAGTFHQVHHFGDPSLRPAAEPRADAWWASTSRESSKTRSGGDGSSVTSSMRSVREGPRDELPFGAPAAEGGAGQDPRFGAKLMIKVSTIVQQCV